MVTVYSCNQFEKHIQRVSTCVYSFLPITDILLGPTLGKSLPNEDIYPV